MTHSHDHRASPGWIIAALFAFVIIVGTVAALVVHAVLDVLL